MPKSTKINVKDRLRWQLGERVKELTALHRTALILNRPGRSITHTMRSLVLTLPKAWQYPEITAVKISWAGKTYASSDFKKTRWNQKADFKIIPGQTGSIEVCYLKAPPRADQGPFEQEEELLLNSLAVMIKTYLQNRIYQKRQVQAKTILAQQVKKRTIDLTSANADLRRELARGRRRERWIKAYQEQLKWLASELCLAEERERRSIASDLHDNIGQALAIIKMKFLQLHCNSVLCKFQDSIEELRLLLDDAIGNARSLTFEISPPVLYELGLTPALQWLAEEFHRKYHTGIEVTTEGTPEPLSDDLKVTFFRAVRELLFNAAKHAKVSRAWVRVVWERGALKVEVRDDGAGFDASEILPGKGSGFGLFSVRERMSFLGGGFDIDAKPGQGTVATLTAPLNRDQGGGPR
ncbi:sensor histidine kinase [candidate division TA06 bacterium]|uniref:Oxygen sensor histidine kinase NreB n=1 Tax=candidate division TA06 bacterium TaxID=2250710 RepID=A0A933MKH1_UNCT6|nr:sensor histidine kinase [candidate division TA06 bacterium]